MMRPRAMLVGGSVVMAIMLGTTWVSTATWMRFSGYHGLGWMLGPMLLIGSFVPITLLAASRQHPVLRAMSVISSVALGFQQYAFFAALVCWLTLGVTQLAGLSLDPRTLAFLLYGVAALVSGYGLVNAATLRVTRVTVQLPNLPAPWQGRELALVTDLHVGNIRARRFIMRVVERLRQLQPAAVCISGDMFDGPRVDWQRTTQPWTALTSSVPVYFVSGNHDEFGDRTLAFAALESAGVRVLHNEKVTLEGLQFAGVHDAESHSPEVYQAILQRAAIDPNGPSVLLAHEPIHLEVPEEAGISLALCGHTHRGQCWPWPLLVKRIYGPFAYGLHRRRRLQVCTSSGAGTAGPPMRVGTKSEIVMLRLELEPSSRAQP